MFRGVGTVYYTCKLEKVFNPLYRALCVQGEGTVYYTCKLERCSILCTGPCVFRGREQCTVPVSLRGAPSSVQDLVCSGGGNSILYL